MARSNSSGPLELVAVDLGGTHVRFCTALVSVGTVLELRGKQVFRTADFPTFGAAASAYRAACGGVLPKVAALAVACPVKGDVLPLTNLDWKLVRSEIGSQMGMDEILILNDFVAQSHAVANLPAEAFERIGGPAPQLPSPGLITIVGPGTGLGVGHMLRLETGYRVLESEGGHIGFAPTDDLEDRMLRRFRAEFGRVSAERLISGLGLCNIHAHLRAEQGLPVQDVDARTLWSDGLEGRDALASQAIDLFCAMLGSFAGDCALLSGARLIVIGGGLAARLGTRLDQSDFMARFLAKGRLGRTLEDVSVQRVVCDEPGLLGAALAYANR